MFPPRRRPRRPTIAARNRDSGRRAATGDRPGEIDGDAAAGRAADGGRRQRGPAGRAAPGRFAGPALVDRRRGADAVGFRSRAPRGFPSCRRGRWNGCGWACGHVVADPQGTGYKTVRLKDVAIAGKTGTAEAGGRKPDHAWFAGYVPADRPTIAFVVVLENAGPGGHAAGPVAREFVQALLALGLLDGAPVPAPLAN